MYHGKKRMKKKVETKTQNEKRVEKDRDIYIYIYIFFFLSKWIHISTNKITMMIKQKIKNTTKYNNINNTRNYTNTGP